MLLFFLLLLIFRSSTRLLPYHFSTRCCREISILLLAATIPPYTRCRTIQSAYKSSGKMIPWLWKNGKWYVNVYCDYEWIIGNAICICQAFLKSWCSHVCELVINCWDVEFVIVKFCLFYDNMVSYKRYISLELAEL